MAMFYFFIFSACLFSTSYSSRSFAEANVQSSRARIEDLVIWKFSDELKLSAIEEKKFSDFFRELSRKKSALDKTNLEIVQKLKQAKNKTETEKILTEYKKNVANSERLAVEEVEQMLKSLGSERTRQYLVLKFELNRKLRDLNVPAPSKTDQKKLPPPRIIEE